MGNSSSQNRNHGSSRPLKILVRGGSAAETTFFGAERMKENQAHRRTPGGAPAAGGGLPAGIHPTPDHDLQFRGGKTLPSLAFANIYVSGDTAWNGSDRDNIDQALQQIMGDPGLNNIVGQYFNGGSVSATFTGRFDLSIPPPSTVTRGDVDALVQRSLDNGLIKGDLEGTIFNFLLPPGTVLTDDSAASGSGAAIRDARREPRQDPGKHPLAHDPDDKASSLQGLGGYHGSVHVANQRVYFAVGVYSQDTAGGQNGIVAFDQPWKNVVATFYHELQEARTDPDVEDAIRLNSDQLIGWNSNRGEEIGDFPVFEDPGLHDVFVEIPLASGSTQPVQLIYSNRVHGPEVPA